MERCFKLLVLSFSMASTSRVLLAREGRGLNTCLHWGQVYSPLLPPLSQWLRIQAKQYECPQGRVAGSFRVSRHTGQAKLSSSVQAEAMCCWGEMSFVFLCMDHKDPLCEQVTDPRHQSKDTDEAKMRVHMNHLLLKN